MKFLVFGTTLVSLAFTVNASALEQKITADDFGEEWPFTVEEGILSCANDAVTFRVDRTTYAVNGTATMTGKYKEIEQIWAVDQAMYESLAEALKITVDEVVKSSPSVYRLNISPIIDAGLALCKKA